MKEPILVVMAAGIGSRYGAGIKQLARVGPCGELLIDYSIYDAVRAGFKRVIFIIRRDIEADFREVIGDRLEQVIRVQYVYQEREDLPEGCSCPPERTKPWGTGQAVLAAAPLLDGPFAVINADDYYGREAFKKIYQDLTEAGTEPLHCAMVSFVLKNTLSENGTVTRGICITDGEGGLTGVHETREIRRGADGVIRGTYGGAVDPIPENAPVSMNLWGLSADFIGVLREGFRDFLTQLAPGDLRSEYLLPVLVDRLLQEGRIRVRMLQSSDRWFGITYREDRAAVAENLKKYTAEGRYPAPLFGEVTGCTHC